MPLLPYDQCKEALEHVVMTVFRLPQKNEIWSALVNDARDENHLDVYVLIRMTEDHIDSLKYKATAKAIKMVELPKGLKVYITNFQAFYWDHKGSGNPITDFLSITANEFDEFLVDYWWKQVNDPNNKPTPLAAGGKVLAPDPLADFKKGVKHDPTHFPPIKDIKQWDSWKRLFVATAEMQGVKNVLEIAYTLHAFEVNLFKEQQKYVYSVLLNTVKAPTLKSIIIDAKKDNIQKCWDDLVQEAEWSTSAEIKAADLLQYITSSKIDDGKWRGTSKDFIIHWCEQLQLYETLCEGKSSHFSKPVKTQMLQNTLDSIPEF